MLEVTNLRVHSFDLDHLNVEWDTDGNEDPNDYTFEVLRSEVQFGPFVPVTGPFRDKYHFRDTTVPQRDLHRTWYYKIRVRRTRAYDDQRPGAEDHPVVRDYPEGMGIGLQALPDLEALEMARQFRLRLEEYVGRVVWVYPIRTFGHRCTCYDRVTSQRVRSNCNACYDTSFVGGYHSPIQISMEITTPPQVIQVSELGKFQPANTMGKLSNFPLVQENWVVVEAENIRWRVASPIHYKAKLRAIFRQEFGLHRIPRDDVAYKLPVNVDGATLQASPVRQFTNPHDLLSGAEAPSWGDLELGAYNIVSLSQISGGVVQTPTILVVEETNGQAGTIQPAMAVSLVSVNNPSAARDGFILTDATGSTDPFDVFQAEKSHFFGVTAIQVASGAKGQITRFGRVTVTKRASETWWKGDPIYLTTTPGKLSKDAPGGTGNWIKRVGVAAESSSGTVGKLDIGPEPGVQVP